jgi:hypothetical protein
MFGCVGLGYFQSSPQLTNTHGFVLQHLYDFNPIRVGKRLHDLDK